MSEQGLQPTKKDRRKRALTDADVQAITEAIKEQSHSCQFSSEEVQFVRDFLTMWKETRSTVLKGFIGLVGVGLIMLAAAGALSKVQK